MDIKTLSQQALLADASYADFWDEENNQLITDKDDVIDALKARFESEAIANQFYENWQVISQQPDLASGFSATLFKNKHTGEYVFANRGTAGFFDDIVSADFLGIVLQGKAPRQLVDMYRYFRKLETPQGQNVHYTAKEVEILESFAINVSLDAGLENDIGLGAISSDTTVTVTGHSLGGHLATWFSAFFGNRASHIYTFNGAGLGGVGVEIADLVTRIFRNGEMYAIPNDRITNLYAEQGLEVTAGVGAYIGSMQPAFIEDQGFINGSLLIDHHFMNHLTDSLTAYQLISGLDPALSFDQITAILEAGSNKPKESLETIVNAIGDVFKIGVKVEIDMKDQLHKRIQAIETKLYIETNIAQPQLKPQYQNLQLVDVNSLADSAKENNLDGFAYRYALVNLNPFAITGNVDLYTQHNADGELNIDKFSDSYLQDRAEFLLMKNTAYSNDYTGVTDVRKDEVLFQDLNADITIGLNSGILGVAKNIIFGSNNAEIDGELDGDRNDDRLYGGGGFDIIKGGGGNDYIEGNSGDDVLEGGEGFDTLIGGAGGDNLHGGASGDYADILDGGQDHDIYHIETSDGDTIIRDSDLQGQIEYDGVTLGTNIKAIVDGGNSYQDDDKNKYTFTTNDLIITLENGQRIVIENYSEADQGKLGLSFGAADAIEPAPITDPVIVGDFEWKDFDLDEPGIQFKLDSLGNEIQDFDKPTDMRDTLNGSGGNDLITPGVENDTVHARGGNDIIQGGTGIDQLHGQTGDDLIQGDEGSDILYGGAGEDILHADGVQNLTIALNADNGRNSRGSLLSGGGDNKLWFFLKTLLQLSNKLNYTQENNRDTAHNLTSIN